MALHGYVRVSTLDQADTGQSLQAQQQQVTGYAMMLGQPVTMMHVESGVSGSIPFAARPAGSLVLPMLRAGDIVVTPKLDRAFRSSIDALTTQQSFRDMGVALHVLDMGGDVTGGGIGQVLFTVCSAFAEFERTRCVERQRDTKASMRARGLFQGGRAPYGHDVVDGRLVPNAAEQANLVEMKRQHRAGISLNQIGIAFGLHRASLARMLARLP